MIIRHWSTLSFIWLVGAIALAICSFLGSDLSIIVTWLFLAWTMPFGIIWWFYIYPFFYGQMWAPEIAVQATGEICAVLLAFVFWFVAIPKLWTFFGRNGRRLSE